MFKPRYNNYTNQLRRILNDQTIFNSTIHQTRIYITIIGLNIKDNESNLFGLQKTIDKNKLLNIEQYLLSENYKKNEEIIKKSQYGNKIRIQQNTNDNEYYKISTLNTSVFNNIVFSELNYQTIEPSQFPNVVKYTKYNSTIYTKNNISISFNLYNFNNQNNDKQNYNVEIVIKKYENLLFSEKTIFELNKVISILNNEEQNY